MRPWDPSLRRGLVPARFGGLVLWRAGRGPRGSARRLGSQLGGREAGGGGPDTSLLGIQRTGQAPRASVGPDTSRAQAVTRSFAGLSFLSLLASASPPRGSPLSALLLLLSAKPGASCTCSCRLWLRGSAVASSLQHPPLSIGRFRQHVSVREGLLFNKTLLRPPFPSASARPLLPPQRDSRQSRLNGMCSLPHVPSFLGPLHAGPVLPVR